MEDIKYSKENIKFALRVGAIIYDKNKEKVLLFRGNDMNFYMLQEYYGQMSREHR